MPKRLNEQPLVGSRAGSRRSPPRGVVSPRGAFAALLGALLAAAGGCSGRSPPAAQEAAGRAAAAAPAPGSARGRVSGGGTSHGRGTLAGKKPALPPVRCARDPDICGKARPNQTVLVGADGGLKDVIVSLTDIHAGKPVSPVQAKLDIRQCAYAPRVQAVPVGSSLAVTSRDQVPHDLGGTLGGRSVFNRVVLGNTEKVELFTAGVLKIGCDTHGGSGAAASCETGVVGVMPNPYFAVTGEDGAFSLAGVPHGTYTVQAWHETLGEQRRSVTLAENGSASVELQLEAKGAK